MTGAYDALCKRGLNLARRLPEKDANVVRNLAEAVRVLELRALLAENTYVEASVRARHANLGWGRGPCG